MGFINYHGKKEDRYSELVNYSRARQSEETKKNEEDRISLWLKERGFDERMAHLNVQELLKLIVIRYGKMKEKYDAVVTSMESSGDYDVVKLWNDFSIDLADRHITSFNVSSELRSKHLQVFIDRIFKLSGTVSASEHIDSMANNKSYRKYYVDCFDPIWGKKQFYSFVFGTGKDAEDKAKAFFKMYNEFVILLDMYLHQAFNLHEFMWLGKLESEMYSIAALSKQGGLAKSKGENLLKNPLYCADDINVASKGSATKVDVVPDIHEYEVSVPKSKLDRNKFNNLINEGGLANYIIACKMIVECELPCDIIEIYNNLIERMTVLKDAVDKHDSIYHADLERFNEYYAPETLKVASVLAEYEVIKPSDKVLSETRENVHSTSEQLLIFVNDTIDEIYRFVTLELKAEAKAIESIMDQEGYVSGKYKI